MKKLFVALAMLLSLPMAFAADQYSPGHGYTVIASPVRTENPDKIEVTEVFWYGCPHCFHLEPISQEWQKHIPSDVDFHYMPAVFGRGWEAHARAYYVSELLGIHDKIHTPLFNAIHVEKQRLNTKETLAKFFEKFGVSEASFNKQYDSFAVNSRMSQADSKIRAYGIRGVPSLIVNGKYLVSAETAGGSDNIFNVVDFLIEKERKESK